MVVDTKKIIAMLNKGLEMEYASYIQYVTQASITKGPYAEALIARFEEIATDEAEHAKIIRQRIVAMGGVPTTKVGEIQVHADSLKAVQINLKYEKDTVEFYRKIFNQIPPDDPILYEAIEHILQDSQEHVEELERLAGK